jgi:hypothetical protein
MSARAADVSMKTNRGCGCKGNASVGGCGCGGSSGGGCGCGCGGSGGTCAPQGDCATQCCELECLVRPNFFCGQLLTDADLSAMVEWTRKRFALSRYKDGWGVVCGLDVTCGPPDGASAACCDMPANGKGPFVWLAPGYAIDCCGNDLVVCEPLRIDLSSICRPPYDPCDPNPKPATQDPVTPITPVGRGDELDPCFSVDRTNLFAVQVSLRYHEDLAQGQRAMFRSGGACVDTAACEYARVIERPCVGLDCIPLPVEGDTGPDEVEQWLKQVNQRVKQLFTALRSVVLAGPDAVLAYLRANPPYQSCYLEELVCCLRTRDAKTIELRSAAQLAGLIMADQMAREFACDCFGCRPDNGVPLGAVLLRRSVAAGRTTCKVYSIEFDKRYRRYLRKELCQRLREGTVDLTRYVGQPVNDVHTQLRGAGMQMERLDIARGGAANLEELGNMINAQVYSVDPSSRQTLRAQVVVDPVGTARVFGFVPG